MGVEVFLLAIAAVFLVGVVGELVFARTGVPDVVWLIAVGVIIGPVLGLVDDRVLTQIAPYFGALTLVIVLFDGGVRLRLGELVAAVPRSAALAILGFTASVLGVALIAKAFSAAGVLPKSWTMIHCLILGTIVGGASSVVIMPALDQAKLDERISNLLKLESALTDVLCVVGAVTLIELAVAGAFDRGAVLASLGTSFGVGGLYGVIAGLLWFVLHRVWGGSRHEYPITLAGLLILYVVASRAGGSAALAILAAAVMIGNAGSIAKLLRMNEPVALDMGVERFHGVVSFMIKSFFFTFIGLMLRPPWALMAVGAALGVVLLVSRWPVVKMALWKAGFSNSEVGLVTFSMPRGMAAGVLAIMPAQAGVAGMDQLPVVVFSCVVVTILAFAGGLPVFTAKMAAEAAGEAEGVEALDEADDLDEPDELELEEPASEA